MLFGAGVRFLQLETFRKSKVDNINLTNKHRKSPYMKLPFFIVSFAGIRPSSQTGRSINDISAQRSIIQQTLASFMERAKENEGCIHLHTSAAAGSDVIACEEAIKLGIPVQVFLPMPVCDFRRDFDSFPLEWDKSYKIIMQAKGGFNNGSLRYNHQINGRGNVYEQTNQALLQNSSALIAITNGISTGKPGGTYQTISIAKQRNLPVVLVLTRADSYQQMIHDQQSALELFSQNIQSST